MKNKKNIFKELLGYLIVAVIAAVFSILLRIFIIEPYIVPTPSMSPTLLIGDRVIVNKLEYKFYDIERGDIVAIISPIENKNLVKRVVALPGEEVTLSEDGRIYIDGKLLQEDYLPSDFLAGYDDSEYLVADNQFFVMGDNRNNSADSRVFGPVTPDEIFGKVIFIYRPVSRMGIPR